MQPHRSIVQPSKGRKPALEFSFHKSAPPRPSASKIPQQWREQPEINEQNARRQIFVPTDSIAGLSKEMVISSEMTGKTQIPLVKGMLVSSSPYRSHNAENNMTEENGHPAKRRRGTPKRAPLIPGAHENSPGFREQNGMALSPAAAKSLFAPLTDDALERKLEATASMKLFTVKRHEDPWEMARNLSPDQQRHHYWKLCYGSMVINHTQDAAIGSWSAQRVQPHKGCLAGSSEHSVLDSGKILAVSPSFEATCDGPFATPKTSPRYNSSLSRNDLSHLRTVQFGPTQAAEYESEEPASTFKPLPAAQAALLYPTEELSPTEAEVSFLQETKDNTAMLEEWEDQNEDDTEDSESMGFSLIQNSDDSSQEEAIPLKVPRLPVRPNRKRRSSAFFAPSSGNDSLLDDSEEDEKSEKSDISTDTEEQLTPPSNGRNGNVCASSLVNIPGLSLESPGLSPGSPSLSIGSTASTIERLSDDSIETVETASVLGVAESPSAWSGDLVRATQVHNDEMVHNMNRSPIVHAEEQASGLIWSAVADKIRFLGYKPNKSDSIASMAIGLPNAVKPEEQAELFRFATNRTKIAETEIQKIRQCQKPLSGLSTARKHFLSQRVEMHLKDSIQQLENRIKVERTRLSSLKQNINMLSEFVATQKEMDLCKGMEELAPMQSAFLPDGTWQITFNSVLSGISGYAPGKTVRILSDSSTAKVLRISLIDTEPSTTPNQNETTCQNQLECCSILERELEGISTRELDCSETVTYLLIFLSRLGRYFQVMASETATVS